MALYYYSLLAVFAVVIYMMSVDKNVADFLLLNFRLFKLNIERWQWMIINHPDNFITTWWRAYRKFIREFQANLPTDHKKGDSEENVLH